MLKVETISGRLSRVSVKWKSYSHNECKTLPESIPGEYNVSVVLQIFIDFPLGNLRTVGVPLNQFVLMELLVYVFAQCILDHFIFLQCLECSIECRRQVFHIFDLAFFLAHL